jgi:chaperonin GroES
MIQPILHRLLVKPDEVETKTKTGIILAVDEKREAAAAERGTVIAVGDTCFKDYGADSSLVKVGNRVYFARYAGKKVTDNEQDYIILNDEDIVGVLHD